MKYFSLSELTHSDTAVSLGLDNTPTAAAVPLMIELIDRVLDPLRESWGGPICVSSGYRCPMLNEKVGGVEGSYHTRGMAADIYDPRALGPAHPRHERLPIARAQRLGGRRRG